MTKKNKVKFGLKNVHVWPIENETAETVEYGAVIKVPGAVDITLNPAGDSNTFYADDIPYWQQFSNNGYEGDLELALIPEEYEIEILGYVKDANGAIVESTEAKSKNYAMAFEFDGDVNQTRHILYNCASSRPETAGHTKEDKVEPQTDKLTFTAGPRMDTGHVKAKIEKGMTGYDTWFDKPYEFVEPTEGP